MWPFHTLSTQFQWKVILLTILQAFELIKINVIFWAQIWVNVHWLALQMVALQGPCPLSQHLWPSCWLQGPLPYPRARVHRNQPGHPRWSWGRSLAEGCSVAPWPHKARTRPSRCCHPSASPASATWPSGFETRPDVRQDRKQKSIQEETQ